MNNPKKILIIRFNSIGDIVLTSPVISSLFNSGYEVHYLCKSAYTEILKSRPDIHKVWSFQNDLSGLLESLKKEKFDFIADLHNNYRSQKVKRALKVDSNVLKKPRFKNWLLTQWGIHKRTQEHIVKRFLKVVEPLNLPILVDKPSFYFSEDDEKSLQSLKLPSHYICIAVGAAFYTKQIPTEKIIAIINSMKAEFVLIGGNDAKETMNEVETKVSKRIFNLVGQINIQFSARVIESSEVLLTGDTGMMHIAAAINKPVVAIFGSTHPVLGYTPYYEKETPHAIIQNESLECRPCTKQGKYKCPKGHFKCMKDIETKYIIDELKKFI